MTIRAIDGLALDGSSVTATLGKLEPRVSKLEYGDTLETESVGSMGSQKKQDVTPGSVNVEQVKISFYEQEWRDKIYPALPRRGFGNVRFPITINYSHPDLGDDSDLLVNARLTGTKKAVEAGSKALLTECTFTITEIQYGESRKTMGSDTGSVVDGSSGF